MIAFTERDGAIIFAVRVQPRAQRNAVVGLFDEALKIKLAAPPVDGAANEELIYFLAQTFAVARKNIHILSGTTAKNKIIQIDQLAAAQFLVVIAACTNSHE